MVAKFWKFKILVNFGHFWSFGAPVEAFTDSSPLILEVHHNILWNIFKWDQSRVISSIRLEVIKEIIHDFGQFWPFLVLEAPVEAPMDPPPLILEV